MKALTSAILIAILLSHALMAATSAKPNFVVTIADDHGVDFSTPYGASEMRTPHIQALADQGLCFDEAYVASPACGPSRAALFTGLMPYNNGIVGNHETHLKAGVESLIPLLQAQGYEVAFSGKVAHGREKHHKGYVPNEVKIIGGNKTRQRTMDYIEAFLESRPEDAPPLALFIGWTDTHTAFPPAERARLKPEQIKIPERIYSTREARIEMSRYLQGAEDIDVRVGKTTELVKKHLDPGNTLVIYTSDHGMPWPFGKWSLYEFGIRTAFIASWPGKIKPNTRTNAMISWIDFIPTLIDLSGGKTPKEIDGRSFAKVLLGETDQHRKIIYATHKGDGDRNVYPSRSVRVGNWKYILNLNPEFANTTHTDVLPKLAPKKPAYQVHGGAHWLSYLAAAKTDPAAKAFLVDYHSNPAEELYNLAEDPHEQKNLANNSEHAKSLAELRTLIENRMIEVSDDKSLSGKPILLKDFDLLAPVLP